LAIAKFVSVANSILHNLQKYTKIFYEKIEILFLNSDFRARKTWHIRCFSWQK